MSFASLINKVDRVITKGKATELHVFDIRIGQGNITLVGIRKNSEGKTILDKMYISSSKLNEITRKMKESFSQGRLLKIEILQLQGSRITVVNKMEPSPITVKDFTRMVESGEINGNSQMKVIRTQGRFVDLQGGVRTIITYNGVPVQLRTYRSSLWANLMLDEWRENGVEAWDMIIVISISSAAAIQHNIFELTDEKLIEYGPAGAFTLFAVLPLKPAEEVKEEATPSGHAEDSANGEVETATEEDELTKTLAESARQIVEMALGDENESEQ